MEMPGHLTFALTLKEHGQPFLTLENGIVTMYQDGGGTYTKDQIVERAGAWQSALRSMEGLAGKPGPVTEREIELKVSETQLEIEIDAWQLKLQVVSGQIVVAPYQQASFPFVDFRQLLEWVFGWAKRVI